MKAMMNTYTVIRISSDKNLSSPLTANIRLNLLKLACCTRLLDLRRRSSDLVLEQPTRVLPPSQHKLCVILRGLDNRLLDVDVDRRLNGTHEPGAHVDTLSSQAQRRSETLSICESTGGNKGDLERLSRSAQQNQVGDIRLANVASTLEAIDAQEIHAKFNGALSMSDRRALVQDNGVHLLQLLDDRAGGVAGRLDNLDSFVDDDLCVGAVVRRVYRGEQRDIYAEGLRGHGLGLADLFAEVLGRGLCEGCEDTEAACVGDGRGQLGVAHPLHASLHYGDWRCRVSLVRCSSGRRRNSVGLPLIPRARVSLVLKGILLCCLFSSCSRTDKR